MAFLVKSTWPKSVAVTGAGQAVLAQSIHVATATRALPQATTDVIFKVKGGRVLVRGLLGEVTTIIEAADPVLSVLSQKLDAGLSATIGTAVTIATTAALTSLEVGGLIWIEGDGTALVTSNAGNAFIGSASGMWVAPRGQIYLSTTASRTGNVKWDIWYQPLDEAAYVEGTTAAAVKV